MRRVVVMEGALNPPSNGNELLDFSGGVLVVMIAVVSYLVRFFH
jgi:hypothetical protein